MGMRVRLKADYDLSGFAPEAKVILEAMKKYGMILADNGPDNFISGAPDPRWNNDALRELMKVSTKDLEVVEMHHRLKKDAPSGTAKRLVEVLAEVRNLKYKENARHGRQGMVGERTDAEIGVHAIRGGDVIGDHTVIFAGLGERIELTHKASDRAIFARGALRAAQWVVSQEPGVYDMQDVLGLK